MSIQNVLDDLDASKGAFYHYFDSKAALLDAVVQGMVDGVVGALTPIASDPGSPARDKLVSFFATIAQWKGEREQSMLQLVRVWYSDDNALVRERFRGIAAARLTPVLAQIVQQGRAEGAFTPSSSEGAAGVLVSLILGINEVAGRLFLARRAGTIAFEEAERTLAAYTEAVERVLGASPGSLTFVNATVLRQWFG